LWPVVRVEPLKRFYDFFFRCRHTATTTTTTAATKSCCRAQYRRDPKELKLRATYSILVTVQEEEHLKIMISKEYEELVPRMSDREYEALKEDIRSHGQQEPIVLNQSGVVIDGHHRLRACRELGLEPKHRVEKFASNADAIRYVLASALKRRHLTEGQQAIIALKLKPYLAAQARRNMSLGGQQGKGASLDAALKIGRVDDKLARQAGVGRATIARTEHVQKLALEQPDYPITFKGRPTTAGDLYRSVETGKEQHITPVFDAVRKAQLDRQRRDAAELSARKAKLPAKVQLFNMDSTKLDQIDRVVPDDSCDLILSDPPYTLEAGLGLIDALAKIAAKKLKPGGSLIFFFGQHQLSRVIRLIGEKYEDTGKLTYAWVLAVKHEKPVGVRFHQWGIRVDWKPMLWYIKGDKRLTDREVHDHIQSQMPIKDNHPWAQSSVEAEYFIRQLTISEDSVVLDPFLGSGAFAVPAVKLGRYFIGVEIDPVVLERARNYIIAVS
jgi:DNA methylase/ParB-like nuclease domain